MRAPSAAITAPAPQARLHSPNRLRAWLGPHLAQQQAGRWTRHLRLKCARAGTDEPLGDSEEYFMSVLRDRIENFDSADANADPELGVQLSDSDRLMLLMLMWKDSRGLPGDLTDASRLTLAHVQSDDAELRAMQAALQQVDNATAAVNEIRSIVQEIQTQVDEQRLAIERQEAGITVRETFLLGALVATPYYAAHVAAVAAPEADLQGALQQSASAYPLYFGFFSAMFALLTWSTNALARRWFQGRDSRDVIDDNSAAES